MKENGTSDVVQSDTPENRIENRVIFSPNGVGGSSILIVGTKEFVDSMKNKLKTAEALLKIMRQGKKK